MWSPRSRPRAGRWSPGGVFHPLFFDSVEQQVWVESQFPLGRPPYGIFGPVFYATRDAMRRAEPFFPATPADKLEAQGTARASAYTFMHAKVPVGTLGGMTTDGVRPNLFPENKTFLKTFGNRQ